MKSLWTWNNKEREMNKKQFSLLPVLSLLAGLEGGILTSQFFLGTPVLAEKKAGQITWKTP